MDVLWHFHSNGNVPKESKYMIIIIIIFREDIFWKNILRKK